MRTLFACFLLLTAIAGGRAAAQAPVTPQQALAVLSAPAATLYTPGTVVERAIAIGARQVPLPMGQWVVAGDATWLFQGAAVGAFGRMRNLILLRRSPEGGAVDAVAEINVNLLPTTDGWGVAADCARTDLILATVRYKSGWDGSCFFVSHSLLQDAAEGESAPAAWPAARSFAAQQGMVLPRLWLTAGFRATNRADVADIRIHFSPQARGIAPEAPRRWRDSAWSAERLPNDAQRLAVATALSEWAVVFSGLVEAGLKGRLSAEASLPMPENAPSTQRLENTVLAEREAALQALHRAGLLNAEQLAEQLRRLHDTGLEPGSQTADPSTVALYKTLSYRPIVSFLNFWIDLYWIGTPFAAGVLEVLQIVVNSFKFYAHEVAWNQVVNSGTRPDLARTLDFRYLARAG